MPKQNSQETIADDALHGVDESYDFLEHLEGQIANNLKAGRSWRVGMKVQREPFPDAVVEALLRQFERSRAREAQKSREQRKQRGAAVELTLLIDRLAKDAEATGWHRDKAMQLISVVSLHNDQTEREMALKSLAGLADALDGICALQAATRPVKGLAKRRGPTTDIPLQLLVNQLATLFEDRTKTRATITTDGITGEVGGPFLVAAMKAIDYLSGDIAPSESQVAYYARARIEKARKAEISNNKD